MSTSYDSDTTHIFYPVNNDACTSWVQIRLPHASTKGRQLVLNITDYAGGSSLAWCPQSGDTVLANTTSVTTSNCVTLAEGNPPQLGFYFLWAIADGSHTWTIIEIF